MYWEHTRGKLYTPVGLGEILSKRTFWALKVTSKRNYMRKVLVEYTLKLLLVKVAMHRFTLCDARMLE